MIGKMDHMPRLTHWSAGMIFVAASLPAAAQARGAEQTIYSFGCYIDGCFPLGGLVSDAKGALYGTTDFGGPPNFGTVFRLTPDERGHYDSSVLYTLTGGVDGGFPQSVPILDASGNLYATSAAAPLGAVIELKPERRGEWKLARSFIFGNQGNTPLAGVVMDAKGNLYGTTSNGGKHDAGTLFELTPVGSKGWRQTMQYDLDGKDEGYTPQTGLVLDAAGNLYGTTSYGGKLNFGVVFQLSPGSSGWSFHVLHDIDPNADGADPGNTLALGKNGRLYGSTISGGGSVFEVRPPAGNEKDWSFTTLYRFTGGADGGYPYGSVHVARDGTLYGTTYRGGNQNQICSQGCGVVYKLTPPHAKANWTETVLWSFTGGPDGSGPIGALAPCGPKQVCGTAYAGGAFNSGTVFKITE